MPRILTITLNPALDAFTSAPRVEPVHKLRCGAPQFHPGGGGINVARVIHRLGGDVLALFPVGGLTGQRLCGLLDAEGVPTRCLPIAGETRESFTVHETSSGKDWRFVLPGPAVAEAEWQRCREAIAAEAAGAAYVVASGSLPPGVPGDAYAQLARETRSRGARFVLDTSGPALAAALAEGVHLVKPSLRELGEWLNRPLDSDEAQLAACRELIATGRAEQVALSLGERGALLVTQEGAWRAPDVAVESTIGAGDSFLAGLLWSQSRGDAPQDALPWAMAAAAAALLSAGTALSQAADVKRLHALAHSG
jgi:6-phosphofructokinase 2